MHLSNIEPFYKEYAMNNSAYYTAFKSILDNLDPLLRSIVLEMSQASNIIIR